MMMNMNMFSKAAIVTAAIVYRTLIVQVEAQIGEGSVVRQGEDNIAPGKFSTVGGGEQNNAGDGSYNAIGGGIANGINGDKCTIAGGSDNQITERTIIGSTISGGSSNEIRDSTSSFSVITGGGGGLLFEDDNIGVPTEESTLSGGNENRVRGKGTVITGGNKNTIPSSSKNINNVITGGNFNFASGNGSVVVGGFGSIINGCKYSILLGKRTRTDFDNCMVIGLTGDPSVSATKRGQFLADAKSFRFQIGNGSNNKNGDISTTKITDENINKLIEALKE